MDLADLADLSDLYNRMGALDMHEHFTKGDAAALVGLMKGMECWRVLEIGAWKGCSTAVLASYVKPLGGIVVSVDTFRGSEGTWNVKEAGDKDLAAVCRSNLRALGLDDVVVTVIGRSQDVLPWLRDEAFDLVFVDGDHRYEAVLADLMQGVAKVRRGGVICGHDHTNDVRYHDMDEAMRARVDAGLAEDFVPGVGHPGVIRACSEMVGNELVLAADGSSLWWYWVR